MDLLMSDSLFPLHFPKNVALVSGQKGGVHQIDILREQTESDAEPSTLPLPLLLRTYP